MIRSAFGLLLSLVLMLPLNAALGQTEIERERESLRGAAHFAIVVTVEVPARFERDREADVRRLRRAVEQRLSQANIPFRSATPASEPLRHYLSVHVNLLETADERHPFAIELGMYQQARLERDSQISLPARTWHASAVGYLSGDMIVGVQQAALSLLDDFVGDYLRANVPR